MRSKEFSKIKNLNIDDSGDELSVLREGSESTCKFKFRGFDKLKLNYLFFHETYHFKNDCFKKEDNEVFVQTKLTITMMI